MHSEIRKGATNAQMVKVQHILHRDISCLTVQLAFLVHRGAKSPEERMLDQAQVRVSYTPPFGGSFA